MAAEQAEAPSGAPDSGIIWAYRFGDDGAAESLPREQVDAMLANQDGWTWVHVALADARARNWLAHQAPISEAAREVLNGPDEHMRLDMQGEEFMGILPDLQQEFARPSSDLVRLRFALTRRVLITARRSPVHALELTRRSIANGRRFPTPIAFVDAVVDQFADAIGRLSETIGERLDQVENRMLADDIGDERVQLGRMRLQLVRMHRQLAQLRMLFHRIEARIAGENRQAARAIRMLAQKLDAIDQDLASQHERARLLLDEIAGKTAAVTNRRLLTLSVLTACLLPPTLVTGFFGMNTKHLPFQEANGGTWFALLIAAAAGGAAYWLLARLRAL